MVKNNKCKTISLFVLTLVLLCSLSLLLIVKNDKTAVYADESAIEQAISVVEKSAVTLYDSQNGLATNDANCVIQTSDGYIWLGGYGGLVRYDGQNFVNYSITEGGANLTNIRSLYEAKDGTLYIGTNEFGIYTYKNGTFTRIDQNHYSIKSFCEDENGTIYAAATKGVCKIVDGKSPLLASSSFQNAEFRKVYYSENLLWAVDYNNNLFCSTDKGLTAYEVTDSGSANTVSFNSGEKNGISNIIYAYGATYLFTYYDGTIYRYDPASNKLVLQVTSSFSSVNSVYADQNNLIWISTDNGIYLYDASTNEVEYCKYISATYVQNIFRDYEGTLWASSSQAGVYKYAAGLFKIIDSAFEIEDVTVTSTVFYNGIFYIASDGRSNGKGLVVHDKDNALLISAQSSGDDLQKLVDKFKNCRIRCLFLEERDGKKNLWLCSYGESGTNGSLMAGAFCYELTDANDDRKIDFTTEQHFLSGVSIRNAKSLANGDMVFGTAGNLVYFFEKSNLSTADDNNKKEVISLPSTTNMTALCVEEFGNGNIFVGTDGGGIVEISRDSLGNYNYVKTLSTLGISDSNGENFSTANGTLSTDMVMRMEYASNVDGLWISTGNDLNFYDGQKITSIDKLSTLGIGSILDLHYFENSGKL